MNARTLSRLWAATIMAVGLMAIAPGCVERTETIRIEPGGTAHLRVVFKGDPDDIRTGDALLNEPGPWSVTDTVEPQDDGSKKLIRTATLVVPAGAKWPEQYCPDGSDLSGLALAMPTALRIEERPDGTYYHFKRVYERRDWARVDYFRRTLVEPAAEAFQGKQKEDVTPQQRENLARGLVQYEKAKTLVLAQAANEALHPGLKQDQWLVLRQAIADVYDRIGVERVVEILQMEDKQAGEEIQRLVNKVSAQVHQAIGQTLAAADATGALGRRFAEQFEIERRRQSISEDLQDEHWEVSLELPGRLVGHNGDSVKGNVVIWKFGGNALCDRDEILMAISVVERRP
jgi:hypothetical protein